MAEDFPLREQDELFGRIRNAFTDDPDGADDVADAESALNELAEKIDYAFGTLEELRGRIYDLGRLV